MLFLQLLILNIYIFSTISLTEGDVPKDTWSFLDPSTWDDRVVGIILFTGGTYLLMQIATNGLFPAFLGSVSGRSEDDPTDTPPLENITKVSVESPVESPVVFSEKAAFDSVLSELLLKNKEVEDVLAINYTITAPIKPTVKEEVKSTKVVPKEKISSLSVKSGIENDKPIYNENPEPFKISKAHADSCLLAFKEGGKKIYDNEKGTFTFNRLNSSEFGKRVDEVILIHYFENLKEHELENLSNEDVLNALKENRSFGIFILYEDMKKKFLEEESECITLEEFTENISFKKDEDTMSSEVEVVSQDFGIEFVSDDESDAFDIEV